MSDTTIIILIVVGWLVCFVFAWGYAWRHMYEMHDSPALAAMTFVMVALTAPLIVVGIPLGKFSIWATTRISGSGGDNRT